MKLKNGKRKDGYMFKKKKVKDVFVDGLQEAEGKKKRPKRKQGCL